MNKNLLIKIFTFLGGLFFFLEYIFPSYLSKYNEAATNGLILMSAVAFGMGIINIIQIHGIRIVFKRENYLFSLTLIIALMLSMIVYSADWYYNLREERYKVKLGLVQKELTTPTTTLENLKKYLEKNFSNSKDLAEFQNFEKSLDTGINKNESFLSFKTVFEAQLAKSKEVPSACLEFISKGLFTPLGASMFALLGFYIAAASYRAFRITSLEAALMMFAALFVILGQTYLGTLISPIFVDIRYWLLTVPNAAAFRAIEVGTSIAALILAIRMWLSLDSSDS